MTPGATTSSTAASTSADNVTSAAASNDANCSGVRGPINADVTAGLASDEAQRQLNQRQAGRVGDLPSGRSTSSRFSARIAASR